ncbi:HWE histidine kinase domain-containing protein [Muricoccus nepalensis]|uniref:HWE histidine kinase domain-containing protein n=1 Tax=Muricoccus nepalensis TaxID=1854500 RepID=UPI00138674A5|nr:HWE histidine kinase domain-containing protein [Roseomonas nepalensis]
MDDRNSALVNGAGVNTAKPLTTPAQDLVLFRTIAEAVSDGVIVTSADLDSPGPRIEYVNPAFTRITGYELDEVLGQTPRILQGPRTDRSTMDRLRAALEQGGTFFGTAVNYRKDGTEYINEWLVNPVRNAEGRLLHWVSAQRDVSTRERAAASQQILLGELNHRVMNNLAAVQSLATRLGRTTSSIQEFRAALQERLSALAQAQKAIVAAHWQSVPLHSLAQAQLAPFGFGDAGRVEASGPSIHLRAGAAVVLGLALHELGLNALKHGALSAPHGRVGLNWLVVPGPVGDKLCVSWNETGGAAITPPTHRGFGLRLIEEVLVRELQGEARISFDPDGVHCLLGAPLSSILDRRS